MHEKRYQIFISSTYTDLIAERRAVQDAIIDMGDFPVQMESFPATDERQMDFIRPLIEQSDYYILIIGGRYGTIGDEDGMSFTHKEFRHAVASGVPVIVLPHRNPQDLAVGKSEDSDIGKKKLRAFIEEAQQNRIRKDWGNMDQLKLVVRQALDHAKRAKPRTGWVRGDTVAAVEVLEQLNEVRKENEKYREIMGKTVLDIPLPKLPDPQDEIHIQLVNAVEEKLSVYQISGNIRIGSTATVSGSWISFFPLFYRHLDYETNEYGGETYVHLNYDRSCIAIASAIAGELALFDTAGLFKMFRAALEKLIAYYTELGLMNSDFTGGSPFSEEANRIARRYYISNVTPAFYVSAGEISAIELTLDSAIPF